MDKILTKNNKIDIKVKVTALGKSVRFASAPSVQDAERVEKLRNLADDMSPILRKKWQRKREIDKYIYEDLELRHKFERVKDCCHGTKYDNIRVVRSSASGHASYQGILHCGNVWACPVCAARIQAARGAELATLIDWAYKQGYKVMMFTLTQPHNREQSLRELMRGHKAAKRKFKSGRAWQSIKADLGIIGTVTADEVTYSTVSGWHWHSHEIVVYANDVDIADYVWALKGRWVNSCKQAGLPIPDASAMMSYGLDIMLNCHATDYLAKMGRNWGVDKEVSHASAKSGAGLTPFELLTLPNGKQLFKEYLLATKGRAQLFWSRGLKALCGVADKSDAELADKAEDDVELIAEISRRGWNLILDEGAEATILTLATRGGYRAVRAWFELRGLGDEVAPGTEFDIFGDAVFDDALLAAG